MKVAIIGAGASGLFCAGNLSHKIAVTIFEKNSIPGKKLLITGNGRCNVTNNKLPNEFLNNVMVNSKFLYSALNFFTPQMLMQELTNSQIQLVEEEDNKIYPKSSKSKTILDYLLSKLNNNVTLKLNTTVTKIQKFENGFLVFYNNEQEFFNKVIIATGGKSYSSTGSCGDGYEFAKILEHTVITPRQSLCGLICKDLVLNSCPGVQFVCKATICDQNKIYATHTDSIMLTSFGVSGPGIFKLTSKYFENQINNKTLLIDFLPNLPFEQVKEKLNEFIANNPNLEVFNFITPFLVKRLAYKLKETHNFLSIKNTNLSKENQNKVINLLKNYKIQITDFESFDKAIVTRGGVSTKEINPKTFESKICQNLYFLGEVIDVDALTGGYSLQIAFSSAYCCANHINCLQ